MELNAGILKEIDDSRQEALDLLMELGKIPAPSNHEEKRAEFCKTCIDAGVNAILGHSPHELCRVLRFTRASLSSTL